MKDLKKIQEFFSKPLNEYSDEDFDSLEDAIANAEFGMDYDQLGPGEKEWVDDEMSMNEDLELIDEDNSYARVSKPRFVKDKRNPNFLNVYIDYDLGPGGSSIALGKETMTGQIRRESAAEAMRLAGDVARDLEAEYDLEDIDIQDLENGKVRIFAISDDFINMDPNMLGEAKEEDKIDIVTMDVPLFIRALEYAKEDAQEDMDLHDFAERAISATKQQGILQMDDYDMLVGDKEPMDESVNLKQSKLSPSEYQKAKKLKAFDAKDWKWNADEDLYIKSIKESIARNLAKKLKKQINEEFEDNGAEEKSFDAELMAAANGIAATLGKELKAKQGDKEQLDEAVVTSIIAAILTGNALIGFISKMSKKLAKKFNWKKGEDFADKVHKWAHDNEVAFQKPIKRILKFFIKDEAKLEATTKGIYALIIISMAAGYGAEAASSLSHASWFKASIAALKGIAKGDEAIATAYPILKSFIA